MTSEPFGYDVTLNILSISRKYSLLFYQTDGKCLVPPGATLLSTHTST